MGKLTNLKSSRTQRTGFCQQQTITVDGENCSPNYTRKLCSTGLKRYEAAVWKMERLPPCRGEIAIPGSRSRKGDILSRCSAKVSSKCHQGRISLTD